MRLIDGDALKDRFEMLAYDDWNQGTGTTWARAFGESADVVECAPAIDAVEVVRCRDCIHAKEMTQYGCGECVRFCERLKIVTSPEWFCAEGRRKDETALQD